MSDDALLWLMVGIVGWLTAAATAVRSVSRIWLRHWVERRLRGSEVAERYLERPARLLFAAGAGAAVTTVLAGMVIAREPRTVPLALAVAAWTVLFLVLGQLLPRAIARRWASTLVPVLVPVLRIADLAAAPIRGAVRAAVRPLRRHRTGEPDEPARDDLEDLLREGELEGVGEKEEIAIISGVVQFGEKRVAEVMTGREELFAVDLALPPDEIARRIAASNYSRVPLYRGSLDHIEGFLHAFDVLKAGGDRLPRLRPVAEPAPDTPCNELLFSMLRKRIHFAVVRDAERRVLGIVTLEDLLEELVGEIADEHDEPPRPDAPLRAETAPRPFA